MCASGCRCRTGPFPVSGRPGLVLIKTAAGRALDEQAPLLAQLQPAIITLRCRGYIFFGSTLKILNDVMGSVVLPPELQPTLGKHKSSVGSSCASLDSQPGGGMGSSTGSVNASPGGPPKPTKFVLFDFSAVSGLDAIRGLVHTADGWWALTASGLAFSPDGVEFEVPDGATAGSTHLVAHDNMPVVLWHGQALIGGPGRWASIADPSRAGLAELYAVGDALMAVTHAHELVTLLD